VPRQELLGHLRSAADVLDQLAEQEELPHLLLSPQHLLLADGRARLTEAGVGAWFWQAHGQALAGLNARHGAPELATAAAGRQADQYCLALMYLEMLTGTAYSAEKPQALRLAPIRDRDVLARALHAQPEQRWPSCRAFIDALMPPPAGSAGELRRSAVPPPAPPAGGSRWGGVGAAAWHFKVAEVIKLAAGAWQLQHHKQLRYLLRPGELLLHRCASRLPAAVAAYKMEAFVQRHKGVMQDASAEEVAFQVPLADRPSARAALGVKIRFQPNDARSATALTVITIEIQPLGCEPDQTERLLREIGPVMLESVRDELQARGERRADERLPWEAALTVRPVLPGGELGEPILCRTRDISLRGVGLVAPVRLPLTQLMIDLPAHEQSEAAQVLARVVRVEVAPDGTFTVGAQFLPRPS
jgi:hypothetical protein